MGRFRRGLPIRAAVRVATVVQVGPGGFLARVDYAAAMATQRHRASGNRCRSWKQRPRWQYWDRYRRPDELTVPAW
jgi:hypothetical protein